jgi:hypothetical protein
MLSEQSVAPVVVLYQFLERKRGRVAYRQRYREPDPIRGPGQFQWNERGWMGCQLGSSAWLLVGAFELLSRERAIAIIWFSCFVCVNSVGKSLWNRRARVVPFKALQGLLLTALLAGLFAWFFTVIFRPDLLAAIRTGRDAGALTLTIIPAILVWFWLAERSGSRTLSSPTATGSVIELPQRRSLKPHESPFSEHGDSDSDAGSN